MAFEEEGISSVPWTDMNNLCGLFPGVLGDLECWMGGCGISIEGAVEMPDCTDSDPRFVKM